MLISLCINSSQSVQRVHTVKMEGEDAFVEWNPSQPNYMHIYAFEKIDVTFWRKLIANNFSIVLLIGFSYIYGIYYGQIWMKSRPAFSWLKKPLILWNAMLALFSLAVCVRCIPELVFQLYNYGFNGMLCYRGDQNHASAFWGLAFTLSKIVELGDTAFIIARKRPLIFLHWFHHITMLLFSLYFYPSYEPYLALSSLVNALVHTFMYTYYALMTAGFKINKRVAMGVTLCQMCQFSFIIFCTVYLLAVKLNGHQCQAATYKSLKTILLIITSYFVLFGKFFKNNYVDKMIFKRNSSLSCNNNKGVKAN